MHLTSIILLAAAGASAHPSGHAHLHRHAHQKRSPVPEPNPAVGDLVTATVMGKVVSWTNTYDGKGSPFLKDQKPNKVNVQAQSQSKATPTPTPSPSPSPSPSSSSAPKQSSAPASQVPSTPLSGPASAFGVTSKTPFCNGQTPLISRATIEQIAYTGNTGAKGNWGCNMMLVANEQTANEYTYTAKFTNLKQTQQICTCFNKIGPDNKIDGCFNEGIKWTMAPGATQFVAFDSNTQGGCVCNDGPTLLKTSLGQLAGTWLEVDFDNTSNEGWSGADASSLVAQKYGMNVDGLQVCAAGTCSTIEPFAANQTPRGKNAYLGGMEDLDGVGINHGPGPVRLDVKVGYSG